MGFVLPIGTSILGSQGCSASTRTLDDMDLFGNGADHSMNTWAKFSGHKIIFEGLKRTCWLCSQRLEWYGLFQLQNGFVGFCLFYEAVKFQSLKCGC